MRPRTAGLVQISVAWVTSFRRESFGPRIIGPAVGRSIRTGSLRGWGCFGASRSNGLPDPALERRKLGGEPGFQRSGSGELYLEVRLDPPGRGERTTTRSAR